MNLLWKKEKVIFQGQLSEYYALQNYKMVHELIIDKTNWVFVANSDYPMSGSGDFKYFKQWMLLRLEYLKLIASRFEKI